MTRKRAATAGAPRNAWRSKEGVEILARLTDMQITVDQALVEAQKAWGKGVTREAVVQAASRYRHFGGRVPSLRHTRAVGESAVTARILEFLDEITEGAARERVQNYEQQIKDLRREIEELQTENETLRAKLNGRKIEDETVRARMTSSLERAGLVGPAKPD